MRAAANDAAGAREHLDRSLALFVRLQMPHAAGSGSPRVGPDPRRRSTRTPRSRKPVRRCAPSRTSARPTTPTGRQRFLRSLGVAGRTGPKLVGELSKREVEVLRLLGEGLTNAEIAARLYISTKTVATHVGNLFAKLQLRNRAEAAAFAHRHLPADSGVVAARFSARNQ